MPKKEEGQNCGNHLKPLDDPDMAGTVAYVEKYYTGPSEDPTGYPLPEKGNDPDHAPPVDVKAWGEWLLAAVARRVWRRAALIRRQPRRLAEPHRQSGELGDSVKRHGNEVNHTNHSMKLEEECTTPERGEDGYIVSLELKQSKRSKL